MKKYVTIKTILLILLFNILISCKKNNVRTIEVDNSFALSLFSDTIVLEDLLSMMDSTVVQWIHVDENGDLSAYYADSIKNVVTGSQIFSELEDIPFELNEVFELPTIPFMPQPVPYELELDSVILLPFVFDDFQINSVVMEGGFLDFNISTDIPYVNRIELEAHNVFAPDGSTLVFTIDIINNNASFMVDFADYQIVPIDDNIVFSAKIYMTVGEQEIGGNYYVNINGGLRNLELQSLDGAVNDLLIPFNELTDVEFGIDNVHGDFKINTPDINIKYVNTFGFQVNSTIDSLYFKDVQNNYISLIKNWEPLDLTFNTSAEYQSVGNLANQIVDEIDVLCDYEQFAVKGDVLLSCDNVTGNTISQDSYIDMIAEVSLPLSFNVANLRFVDTLSFGIGDVIENQEETTGLANLDKIEFRFVIANDLPIKIMPQLYLLENDLVIDSIFEERAVINAGFDGVVPATDIISVSIEDELIDKVIDANRIILDIILSTETNSVILNNKDYFSLRLGVRTYTSEIPF